VALIGFAHELPGPGAQVAAAQVFGGQGPAACGAGADQRHNGRTGASRVAVCRNPGSGQDDAGADSCRGPELPEGRGAGTLRRVRELQEHRGRQLRRPHGSGRGLAHQGRADPRAAGKRPVRPGFRQLQDLPDRRGAHAERFVVQCAVEDAGGAAATRQVPARHHRAAAAAGDGAVALPADQPAVHGQRDDRRSAHRHMQGRGSGSRAGGARPAGPGRQRQHARRIEPAGPGDRLRRRRGARDRRGRHAGRRRPAQHRAPAQRACRRRRRGPAERRQGVARAPRGSSQYPGRNGGGFAAAGAAANRGRRRAGRG